MLSANDIDGLTKRAQFETSDEREKWQSIDNILVTAERHGKKKSKKSSGPEYEYSLKPDICLRINYDRYNVYIRDEAIIHATEERWNRGAGVIMRAILAAALKDESTMRDDRTPFAVTFNEIIDKIPKDRIGKIADGMEGAKASKYAEAVKQYLRLMAEEDAVNGSGNPFLSVANGQSYKVEFERIAVKLREDLVAKLVRERLGEQAARVLAVVARAGKVSETTVRPHLPAFHLRVRKLTALQVRDYAMIQLKDARHFLAELQKLSLIETQEVPKTATKSRMGLPSSSEWHLWQIDLARVYNTLLQSVYKTLGNIVQRREAEVEGKEHVIIREKVAGERERLPRKDVDELVELDDVRHKMGLAQLRSEMVVFLLRDMPGFPGHKL
jgi:DNA-directed RNA polymerase III subunit RPC3